MPLRPLGLGDIFDAAFKVIRFNPGATVGAAVLVSAVAMVLPLLLTGVSAGFVDLSSEELGDDDVVFLLGTAGSFVVGGVLQSVGLVLVSGMIAHVTMAATLGRRMSLGEAWAATRGRRWRLLGLALALGALMLLVLLAYVGAWFALVLGGASGWTLAGFGVLTVPALVALACWFWIRVYFLPVPALMLEQLSVLGAVRRGFGLTRSQFWRIFGIALLTTILTQVAGSLLSTPLAIGAQLPVFMGASAGTAAVVAVVGQALSAIVVAAFTTPFLGAVTALVYVDQRIRKEAFDVDLLTRAGISAP